MSSRNLHPLESPRWRRWLLAAAIALEAVWVALLATLAVVR
jgi:hypothetical protein